MNHAAAAFWIFLGSGLGGLLRWWCSLAIDARCAVGPGDLPLGTLAVNVLGSLLLGLLAATIMGFAQRHRLAAALLLPYAAWSAYAWSLNLAIWWWNT